MTCMRIRVPLVTREVLDRDDRRGTARPTATESDALIESTNVVRASDAISVPFTPSSTACVHSTPDVVAQHVPYRVADTGNRATSLSSEAA